MGEDGRPLDTALPCQTVAQAEPSLARLSLRPLAHSGTETRLFRLGDRHLQQIPKRGAAMRDFAPERR